MALSLITRLLHGQSIIVVLWLCQLGVLLFSALFLLSSQQHSLRAQHTLMVHTLPHNRDRDGERQRRKTHSYPIQLHCMLDAISFVIFLCRKRNKSPGQEKEKDLQAKRETERKVRDILGSRQIYSGYRQNSRKGIVGIVQGRREDIVRKTES